MGENNPGNFFFKGKMNFYRRCPLDRIIVWQLPVCDWRSNFVLPHLSQNLNPEPKPFDEGHNNYQEIKPDKQIWEADF